MSEDDPISGIPGLGPAMEARFAAVGIPTATVLRDLGADAAYARLLTQGERPHFIAYYALHMALQGRPWNDCKGAEKTALRRQFDKLKAQAKPSQAAGFEAILNEIGVIDPVTSDAPSETPLTARRAGPETD